MKILFVSHGSTMRKISYISLVLIIMILFIGCRKNNDNHYQSLQNQGYFLFKTIKLNNKNSRINGMLELWLDKELSKRENPGMKNYIEEETEKLKNAKLVFVKNNIFSSSNHEVPLVFSMATGIYEEPDVYPDGRSLFYIAHDMRAPSPNFNGFRYIFYSVEDDIEFTGMDWIWRNLRMDWGTVKAKSGKGKDIICAERGITYHTDKTGKNIYNLTLERYYLKNNKWKHLEKEIESEYWETDQEMGTRLPDVALFP